MDHDFEVQLPRGMSKSDIKGVIIGKASHVLSWQAGVFVAQLAGELIKNPKIGIFSKGNWAPTYIELIWPEKKFAVRIQFEPTGVSLDVGTISESFDPVLGALVEDIIDDVYFKTFHKHIKRKFKEDE